MPRLQPAPSFALAAGEPDVDWADYLARTAAAHVAADPVLAAARVKGDAAARAWERVVCGPRR